MKSTARLLLIPFIVLIAMTCRIPRVSAAARSQPTPGAAFDPSKIRMKIDTLQVGVPKMEAQCTGLIIVRNTGPGYSNSATQVLPYWMLSIADAQGKEIFNAGGGWSGPMKAGDTKTLTFDTHSNTLPGAGGGKFVFPKPGKYTITMSIMPGGNIHQPVDVKTMTVEVLPAK